jgi:hypothetical protein
VLGRGKQNDLSGGGSLKKKKYSESIQVIMTMQVHLAGDCQLVFYFGGATLDH